MRSIIIIILVSQPIFANAQYFISSEFRREIPEGEEAETSAMRHRVSINAGDERGAQLTVLNNTEGKREGCTWNIRAGTEDTLLTVGNFYFQSGSGLLSGRMKPYIPDPFAGENTLNRKSAISSADGGYPAYTYYGAAIESNRRGTGLLRSCAIFLSQQIRYRFNDNRNEIDSSYSTLLGGLKPDGTRTLSAFPRAAGVSSELQPHPKLKIFLTGAYYDIIDAGGSPIIWSYDISGGCRSSTGCSLYAAYNDGSVNAFSETVFSDNIWINEGIRSHRTAYAWQGNFSFISDIFSLSVSGKYIDTDYYQPYYSAIGKRSPSQGMFTETRVSPYEFFSFTIATSVDKNSASRSYQREQIPSCRESVRFDLTPEAPLSFYAESRGIGEKISLPEKVQFKTGAFLGRKNICQFYLNAVHQKSSSTSSQNFKAGLVFRIAAMIDGTVFTGRAIIKKHDILYQESLSLDDERPSWMAVRSSSWSAGGRLTFWKESCTARAGYSVHYAGNSKICTRFEGRVSGRW